MTKLNNKAFALIEGLLIFVIIAIIGGVGYYIYQANNNDDINGSYTPGVSQYDDEQSKPDEITYKLPDNWSEIDCSSSSSEGIKNMLASPNEDKATECTDRSNSALISTTIMGAPICLSDEAVANIQKTRTLTDYKCEEIKVNGMKGTKTTSNNGDGLLVEYVFVEKTPIGVTYYADNSGKLPYADEVQKMVETIEVKTK